MIHRLQQRRGETLCCVYGMGRQFVNSIKQAMEWLVAMGLVKLLTQIPAIVSSGARSLNMKRECKGCSLWGPSTYFVSHCWGRDTHVCNCVCVCACVHEKSLSFRRHWHEDPGRPESRSIMRMTLSCLGLGCTSASCSMSWSSFCLLLGRVVAACRCCSDNPLAKLWSGQVASLLVPSFVSNSWEQGCSVHFLNNKVRGIISNSWQ